MLPIIGFVSGVFVGAAIYLGGAPGAALSRRLATDNRSGPLRRVALSVICAGQLAVSLLWIVVLYLSVAHLLQDQSGIGVYVAWALALGAAAVPAQTVTSLFTLTNGEKLAADITLRLTVIAAVVLLFIPAQLERQMGWLPAVPVRAAAEAAALPVSHQ